jgi:hypothetical protein
MKTFLVFNRGELLGPVAIDFTGVEISLVTFCQAKDLNDKMIDILYFSDLNYGIVITSEMASQLRKPLIKKKEVE